MSISTKSVNTIREDRARILARYKKDQVIPDLVKSSPAKIEDWEEYKEVNGWRFEISEMVFLVGYDWQQWLEGEVDLKLTK